MWHVDVLNIKEAIKRKVGKRIRKNDIKWCVDLPHHVNHFIDRE